MKNILKFKGVVFMKKIDTIKIISITGTVLGMVGTLLSNHASDKNMERMVDMKVKEAIKNLNK